MIDQNAVLNRPFQAVTDLKQRLPQIVGALVVAPTGTPVVIDFQLAPPFELQAHDYPVEPVRIGVFAGPQVPLALPMRAGLTWEHRNPSNGDPWSDSLCLWYPGDPARLRWDWTNGLASFVALVHRHLLAEEHCRRGNDWPWEAAPHGQAAASRSTDGKRR